MSTVSNRYEIEYLPPRISAGTDPLCHPSTVVAVLEIQSSMSMLMSSSSCWEKEAAIDPMP